MNSNTIIFLVTLLGCAVALPVRPEDNSDPLIGIPILVQGPIELEDEVQEESSPVVYALLLSKLTRPESSGNILVEKRNAKEDEQDDLEAAENYVLRPLFVYRQQLAYRQRVREANRRRNRF